MIIGIDISSIPYGTGVSEYTKQLVLHLLEIDKKNTYKLFLGSLRLDLPVEFLSQIKKSKNCQLYTFPLPPKILHLLWNKLHIVPIEWLIGECDLFHTSDWTQPPMLKAVSVSTIHDLTPFLYPQWQDQSIISAHQAKLQRAISAGSNFISVSQNTQSDFHKLFKKDSVVIYEAADTTYQPIKNPSNNFFLAQGTREPRKNLKTILLAFQAFAKTHPYISLKIAGKYGWGDDIKPIKNVEILGYVSDSKLISLHQNALALVYPSLYEGFGLPVLKSINCHVPVITSNTSSLPEVTGKCGILVNPNSPEEISLAMEKMTKPNLCQKLKKECHAQAKKFSWTKTAQETLNFYQHIYDHRH